MPPVIENRISLDTGCFHTGRLTCLLLDHHNRRLQFFQATAEHVGEVEAVLVNRGKGAILDRLPKLYGAE
jgi:hypothetical protein